MKRRNSARYPLRIGCPAAARDRRADPRDPLQGPAVRLLRRLCRLPAKNGFTLEVKPTNDLAEISRKAGVPSELQGCHTTFVDGYVVDGHVPIKTIRKLLSERPAIAGITLPGMPTGSPGMTGQKTAPFKIYAVNKDGTPPTVYAVE